MKPFPRIETNRLILSSIRSVDIPHIVAHASNRNVSRYTISLAHPFTEIDAVHLIDMANEGFKMNTQYVFGIWLREGGILIGSIGLKLETQFQRAELNFWIAEPFWGGGLTTEAAKAVIHFGFSNLGLHKITATYMEANPASGKVMANCGMKKEGELKAHIVKDGSYHGIVLYGLIKDDYAPAKCSREMSVLFFN